MANPALNKIQHNYRNSEPALNEGVVTLEKVIEKTIITLGLLVAFAAVTWFMVGNMAEQGDFETIKQIQTLAVVFSFVALGLSFWISFKRNVSPPLILLFAAIEGVVIGFISKVISIQFDTNEMVFGAVLGTFVTAGATLAVYNFFDIKVTSKMRKIVMIAMFSFIGVSLLSFVLSMFGSSLGVNGYGPMGMLFSVIGIIIALFMLIIDFDAVEKSIEYRVPEKEAWRLAFALTVTMVWIYINLLRLLTALRH